MENKDKNKKSDLDIFVGLTNEIIENELVEGQACNVLMVCEEHYDLWTTKLFPVLRAQRKSCYDPLVEMFHAQGYTNVTAGMLQSYFSQIRKKRGAL
jgi:hypothetical protein